MLFKNVARFKEKQDLEVRHEETPKNKFKLIQNCN